MTGKTMIYTLEEYNIRFMLFAVFQKLPPCSELEQASIDVDRKRLKAQQLVVTKRVFGQILSAQSACLGEMERVEDIRDRLSGCIEVRTFNTVSLRNRMTQLTCRLCRFVTLDVAASVRRVGSSPPPRWVFYRRTAGASRQSGCSTT